MDETKDFYELPRYPINEKYGEIKRFKSLTRTLPFKFKEILPDEKYLFRQKIHLRLRLNSMIILKI